MFVKIKETWPTNRTVTSAVSSLFHGTHFDQMINICTEKHAFLKGNKKRWRLIGQKDYTHQGYCSYIVHPGKLPTLFLEGSNDMLGPVVWFSTRETETDVYGPCQFEFNFKSVLEAYHRSRGRAHKLCFRAAGSLVYKGEISHIVLLCCKEDKEHESFPLITGGNTKYFISPTGLDITSSSKLIEGEFQVMTNEYHSRHEHVVFAVYLPEPRKLCLSNKDGLLRLTLHDEYCVKSKDKECKYAKNKTDITVDQLKTHVAWITLPSMRETPSCYIANEIHEGSSFSDETEVQGIDEQEERAICQLDKSIEDSFDWLSDMDDTECYDESFQQLNDSYSSEQSASSDKATNFGSVSSQLDQKTEESFEWLSDMED